MRFSLPAVTALIIGTASASGVAHPTSTTGVPAVPSAAGPPTTPPPATAATDRVIFDEELSSEKWGFIHRLPTTFWTPSLREVLKLEERLPGYLRAQLDREPPRKRGARDQGPARRRRALAPPSPVAVPLWQRVFAYRRQYVGLEKNGRHVVWGNFFCRPPRADWRHEPVLVDDGGDCFFQLEYDVDAGRFSNLLVNGEG